MCYNCVLFLGNNSGSASLGLSVYHKPVMKRNSMITMHRKTHKIHNPLWFLNQENTVNSISAEGLCVNTMQILCETPRANTVFSGDKCNAFPLNKKSMPSLLILIQHTVT